MRVKVTKGNRYVKDRSQMFMIEKCDAGACPVFSQGGRGMRKFSYTLCIHRGAPRIFSRGGGANFCFHV